MEINWFIVLLAGLIPLVTGAIWYNPKVFGTAWLRESGLTEEQARQGNMPFIFGLTALFGVFIAVVMMVTVIHQSHIYSIMQGNPDMQDPNSALSLYVSDFMAKYGNNFRTFKHGMLHGALSGFLFAQPVIGILALFERKSLRYIFLHGGYWILTLALMGGVISAFA
ncbi:MAG: DUF1761 domain-containing protein [Saprospiraceae bacterium]|nr:DUF1761 domain-containing protein [Saprospiraceae bacterium]MBP7679659.1 DUF1761 domain-containing protein [Saprospiraceae bacterium]